MMAITHLPYSTSLLNVTVIHFSCVIFLQVCITFCMFALDAVGFFTYTE